MHNKDKIISDKKLPYEYNICLYILEELCDKDITDAKRLQGNGNSGVMAFLYKRTKESICPPYVQSYQLIYV